MSWFGTSPWPSLDADQKLAIGSSMMYLSNARVHGEPASSPASSSASRRCKFVSVESGIGWIPFLLEALDYQLAETRAAHRSSTCR